MNHLEQFTERCLLTGFRFQGKAEFYSPNGQVFHYKFSPVGWVHIALPTLMSMHNGNQYGHPILTGICREASENGKDSPMINHEFMTNGIKNFTYPKTFKEKGRHLLKYMYPQGRE
jgi:hypothetical protein